jgi:mono/diheme cytochrome c family protein
MLAPLLALLLTAPAAAQDGWRTTLTSDHAGQTIEFTSPNAALRLGKGEALHPEIPAHNLIVEYEALLVLPAAGVHRFALEVEGGIGSLSLSNPADPDQVVTIDVSEERGTPLAQPGADLSELLIRVRFERSGANPARLRTLWSGNLSDGSRFDFEPIPGRLVRQAPGSDTAAGDEATAGRVLLEVKGCTNCHAPGVQGAHAVGRRAAPELYQVSTRASLPWMKRWIPFPSTLQAHSDMPTLFRPEELEEAHQIAHFLKDLLSSHTLGGPDEIPPAKEGELQVGAELYDRLACAACHGDLSDPSTPAASSLDHIAVKYTRGGLAEFLERSTLPFTTRGGAVLKPSHADGRMPDFDLSRDEILALVAYLSERYGSVPDDAFHLGESFSLIDEYLEPGAAAIRAKQCLVCHAWSNDPAPKSTAPLLATLIPERGCLDPEDPLTPRYDLSETERAALRAGIASVKRAVGDPAPIDAGRRRFAVLGCGNCHASDGHGGLSVTARAALLAKAPADRSEDAAWLPPDLGDAGWRLREDWIHSVLADGDRARPHLGVRMPLYPPELTEALSAFFAASSGTPYERDTPTANASAELSIAGRKLAGTDHAACVRCHSLGARPSPFPGSDLAHFPERLRREWFDAFVTSPTRLRPGTTMPGLDAGGESVAHDILDGDLALQAQALWAWCEHAHELPAPVGARELARGVIGSEPTVLAVTFAERALLCVGTPAGMHFGWDAQTGQLTAAWLNPFVFETVEGAEDRGAVIWRAPAGPAVHIGDKPETWPTDASPGPHELRANATGDWGAARQMGSVLVHETAAGRVVPELVVLRTVEFKHADSRMSYWFRPGPGELTIESVTGCDARKHPAPAGEAPWIELVVHPGSTACSVRIALRP